MLPLRQYFLLNKTCTQHLEVWIPVMFCARLNLMGMITEWSEEPIMFVAYLTQNCKQPLEIPGSRYLNTWCQQIIAELRLLKRQSLDCHSLVATLSVHGYLEFHIKYSWCFDDLPLNMPTSALLDVAWTGTLDLIFKSCQVFSQLSCLYGTLKAHPLGRTNFLD